MRFYTTLLLSICLTTFLTAQKEWVFDLSPGVSIPIDRYEHDGAELGFSLSTGVAYRFNKIIGLGFRFGMTHNPFDINGLRQELNLRNIPISRIRESGKLNAYHFLFAPQLGYMSDKFQIALVPQLGYQVMSDLDFGFTINIDNNNFFLDGNTDFDGEIVFGGGLLMGASISDRISLSLFTSYLHVNHDADIFAIVYNDDVSSSAAGRTVMHYRTLTISLSAAYKIGYKKEE